VVTVYTTYLNAKSFCILPAGCVCQFDGILCVKIIISRNRIGTLVFVMEVLFVLREVRADCLSAARIMLYDACYQDVCVLACQVGIYIMELIVKCEVLRSNKPNVVPCTDVTLCTGLGKHLYRSVASNYYFVCLRLDYYWAVSATSLPLTGVLISL
jgi:hypothetical protein